MHDLDLASHPELSRASQESRDDRERGLFRSIPPDGVVSRLGTLVSLMNARGVALQDIKYGNVIVGSRTQTVYWVDFERAHLDSYLGWADAVEEQNRLINSWFGLGRVTAGEVAAFADGREIYSPTDFGPLGALGDVSNVEVGEGRWRWLLRDLTDWRGKRVLDLGSNNSLYAFRAAALGAAEVTCVERDSSFHAQAQFVRRVTEQSAGPLNVRLVNGDILTFLRALYVPDAHLDITMALCSIYYLDREQIPEVMRIIARVSRECWLQANVGTERESKDLSEKASPAFLAEQLRSAGFTDITEIAPPRYSRPLLLGRKPV